MIWKHARDCVRRVISIPWFFSSMRFDQGFLVDSIDRHLTLLTAYFTGYVPGSVTEFCEVQLIIPNHCHNQGKFMGELL